MEYSKYLDESGYNFELPVKTGNYNETYNDPFNFTRTTSKGILSINLDSLVIKVLTDKKDSGLNNYTFYNFRDFFNELLDCNKLYEYTIDTEDLQALYSCVKENLKK